MIINWINNDGGGFAEDVEIPEGTTIEQLFKLKLGSSASPSRYLIRVDRQPVAAGHVLTPGCRVSVTPTKIEGA